MRMRSITGRRALTGTWLAALLLLSLTGLPLQGQRTTANIKGRVTDASGQALPAAMITATNTENGYRRSVVAGTNGAYMLNGLQPGTYDIAIQSLSYGTQTRRLEVGIGQDLAADFQLTPQALAIEGIEVVGTRAVETKTSEVATNVTREEIANLPVPDRNFLSLATLTPGIKNANQPGSGDNVSISAGALPAKNMNVFVDGASLKSDVLPSGVAGQDASHGNPFPENAVQEFRVITQNFKAEYQKASSAIITAVTRSGGNIWESSGFLYGQPSSLVQANRFQSAACEAAAKATPPQACDPTANYHRWQGGLSLGGPIKQDKLHFFGSYEGNFQQRTAIVFPGNVPAGAVGLTQAQVNSYAGSHTSPFSEHLGFGKLTYQASGNQFWELSYNLRREQEDRGFGGISAGSNVAFSAAEHFSNNTDVVLLRHQASGGYWLNQAQFSFQRFNWSPTPLNGDQPGLDYQGVIRLGGKDTYQDFTQKRYELRNDLTYSGLKWMGEHSVKGGAYLGFLQYHVIKGLFFNPVFSFAVDPNPAWPKNFNQPFQAQIGVAAPGTSGPDLSANNSQFGAYIQDDWNPTRQLALNLGVRWDFETDMKNDNYVTPPAVVAKYATLLPANYFSNGSNRKPFYGAFQPRLGASYDLTSSGKTVLFGGWGLYYDRDVYNDFLDEKYRRQWLTYTIHFSPTGPTSGCADCVQWNANYLSKAGLTNLIQSGTAGAPEQYFLDNNIKPPKSYQFSAGLRQSLGQVTASATYVGNRGYNGVSYIWGHRNVNPADPTAKPPTGDCCQWGSYGSTLVSDANVQTWYDALQLGLQKPLSQAARWGGNLNVSIGRAQQTGGDLFSFDFPHVADYPKHPTLNDQRYEVNLFSVVRAPLGLMASTIWQLGSGFPYMITDCTAGYGPGQCKLFQEYFRPQKKTFIIPNAFAYRRVDLRLEKQVALHGMARVGVLGEVYNAFNFTNYGCPDTWEPALPDKNANFGNPNCADPSRRYQLGVTYNFR